MARSKSTIFTNLCMPSDGKGNILMKLFESEEISEFFLYREENDKNYKVKLM